MRSFAHTPFCFAHRHETLRERDRIRSSPHPPRSGPPSAQGTASHILQGEGLSATHIEGRLQIAGGTLSIFQCFAHQHKTLRGSGSCAAWARVTIEKPAVGTAGFSIQSECLRCRRSGRNRYQRGMTGIERPLMFIPRIAPPKTAKHKIK